MVAAKGKYTKVFKEFDEAMITYQKAKEAKDFTEEKKSRSIQRITQILAGCAETDKTYKALVYQARNAKIEYSKVVVRKTQRNSRKIC
jgi:hypothetical protein